MEGGMGVQSNELCRSGPTKTQETVPETVRTNFPEGEGGQAGFDIFVFLGISMLLGQLCGLTWRIRCAENRAEGVR